MDEYKLLLWNIRKNRLANSVEIEDLIDNKDLYINYMIPKFSNGVVYIELSESAVERGYELREITNE